MEGYSSFICLSRKIIKLYKWLSGTSLPVMGIYE